MIKEGTKAPDFRLNDKNGKEHKLSDYKKKKVVLYFYPKDNTPGCTKEACEFRDSFSEFKKKGAIIIGISTDDEKSHAKFSDKLSLPFVLLADPEKKVVKKYGVWGEKSFMGRKYMGTTRATFVIDENQKIIKIFPKVTPLGHAKEVLAVL